LRKNEGFVFTEAWHIHRLYSSNSRSMRRSRKRTIYP
jgi:hypothetical protein